MRQHRTCRTFRIAANRQSRIALCSSQYPRRRSSENERFFISNQGDRFKALETAMNHLARVERQKIWASTGERLYGL